MKKIAMLEDRDRAEQFGDFLFAHDIINEIDEARDGRWIIWVREEEQCEDARAFFVEFEANPDDPVFEEEARIGRRERTKREKIRTRRPKVVDVRTDWHNSSSRTMGPLTLFLIVSCVLVAIGSHLGKLTSFLSPLFIAEIVVRGDRVQWFAGLVEVRRGEVWRLVTPIFIHLGLIHLLFNMMWLKDLGSMIETRLGTGYLLALILVVAISSNVSQFFFSGPQFGGMSGVVYGLLGFIWLRGKRDPGCGLSIEKNIMVFMIVWYFLCLIGVVGRVANVVHTVGLLMGLGLGYLTSGPWRRRA